MIFGAHIVINSSDAEADRAFLRDVLGFHAAEVADMLDSSVDSIKSALKRARATLEQRMPPTDRARCPLPDSPGERELVRRFADAFQADDINGLVALLTEDVWLTMPPTTLEYQGPTLIAAESQSVNSVRVAVEFLQTSATAYVP